jgi:hypothetical protein
LNLVLTSYSKKSSSFTYFFLTCYNSLANPGGLEGFFMIYVFEARLVILLYYKNIFILQRLLKREVIPTLLFLLSTYQVVFYLNLILVFCSLFKLATSLITVNDVFLILHLYDISQLNVFLHPPPSTFTQQSFNAI